MSGSYVMDRASLQVGLARTSVRIMLFQDETTLSAQPSVSLTSPSPASACPIRLFLPSGATRSGAHLITRWQLTV